MQGSYGSLVTAAEHAGNLLPMSKRPKREFTEHELSRRERQIMSAVYRLEKATVAEIVDEIPAPPTADAVRRMCNILAERGFLRAHSDGARNVFRPTVSAAKARRTALNNLLQTFFRDSPHRLVATLLDTRRNELSDEDVDRLTAMIEEAEEEGE